MKNTKVIWKGEEKLRSLLVPLESLTCDDANAVKHSPRNIAAIKASLSRRGQYQLVAVQKKGRIVRVGNGRVIAMRELGWTHVAALVINESSADAISRALVDHPAVYTSVIFFCHPTRSGWREHRTVCLPDYQGIGIGNAMSDALASAYRATNKPYRSITAHPAMIRSRAKSKHWLMTSRPRLSKGNDRPGWKTTQNRIVCSFEYVGKANHTLAKQLGVVH